MMTQYRFGKGEEEGKAQRPTQHGETIRSTHRDPGAQEQIIFNKHGESKMALMQITVIPVGTGKSSVGKYITEIIRWLSHQEDIAYKLADMGTEIYGDTKTLLKIAAVIHEIPFNRDVNRVITNIMIDDRRDLDRKIGEKEKTVRMRLEGDKP